MKPAALFLDPRTLGFSYGAHHPFQIERVADVIRFCGALDLLPHDGSPRAHEAATRGEIEAFHDRSYLDALEQSASTDPRRLLAYGLGTGDNPIFPGLWEACRLASGGSIAAARWIIEGRTRGEARRAFHPAGGLHHAHAAGAAGFCYVNDGALAIISLVEAGLRVLYLDIDAHHGDGVQEAFYDSDRALTISIHQDGRTLFPGTGFPNETGRGAGEGFSVNVPILPGADDEDYDRCRDEIVAPLCSAFRPDVIVTEAGADSLRDDPLTLLDWSLAGYERMLSWVASTGLPWLSFGGGRYKRWNVIRGFSLVWARMLDRTLPESRPDSDRIGPLPDSWPRRPWDEPPRRDLCAPAQRQQHLDEVFGVLKRRVFPRHAS